MRVLVALGLLATWCTAVTIDDQGHYSTKYDHYDLERILNHKRLVTYYAMCLTGKGPCPPQGTEFKRILPEALKTNCARCTEKQKVTGYYAIRRLRKEYPKIWAELQSSWDPSGEYVKAFEVARMAATPQPPPEQPDIHKDNENEISTDTRTVRTVDKKTGTTASPATPQTTQPETTQRPETTSEKAPQFEEVPLLPFPVPPENPPHVFVKFPAILRPEVGLKLAGNWIESIGSLGTKVLKTGVRIADMVLSRVQAGLAGRNQQKDA